LTAPAPPPPTRRSSDLVLATEATALVHGRAAAEEAAETARRTFEEGELAETLPTVELAGATLEPGLSVLAAFVKAGLVGSNGERSEEHTSELQSPAPLV